MGKRLPVAAAAVFFVISGLLTAVVYGYKGQEAVSGAFLAVALPYAIASWLLYAGDSKLKESIFSVLAIVATWLMVYCTVCLTTMLAGSARLGLLPAGIIGGLGLCFATAYHAPVLHAGKYRVTACVLGGMLALVCGDLVLMGGPPISSFPAAIPPIAGFTLWETTLGGFFYAAAREAVKNSQENTKSSPTVVVPQSTSMEIRVR